MLYFILVAFFCVLVALFAIQNATVVTLSFIFWEFQQSLVITILLSFIAGLLVASLFVLAMKTRNFLKNREVQDQMLALKQQNTLLARKLAAYEAKEQAAKEQAQQQGTTVTSKENKA